MNEAAYLVEISAGLLSRVMPEGDWTWQTVNTDQSDGMETGRWRNGNVTYSVNRPHDYILRASNQRARAFMHVQAIGVFVLRNSDRLVAKWRHWERAVCFCWKVILKFDLSGVERRTKHDIFQSRYQLGEFHYLYNELRKDSTKFF